jgi:hypothetical protein
LVKGVFLKEASDRLGKKIHSFVLSKQPTPPLPSLVSSLMFLGWGSTGISRLPSPLPTLGSGPSVSLSGPARGRVFLSPRRGPTWVS